MKSRASTEYIRSIKNMYHQLKLSSKQAEQVYKFEAEKDLESDVYFSVFEEFDYDLDNFQKILSEGQFQHYKIWQEKNLKAHEQHLIKADEEQAKYISYHNEILEYYETQYLPVFYKETQLSTLILFSPYKTKIEYLKSEYKKYLDSRRKEIIVSHYRNNKLFSPNTLQVNLLAHKRSYIVPDYFFFKSKIDVATKAVADFVLSRHKYIGEQFSNFFSNLEKQQSEFLERMKEKHIGEISGWHVTIELSEEEKKENRIMKVILLDPRKYAWE